ncbi:hypothetical protein L7F22_043004 [Adiantum nelumboides]|nr:hypothetical protein [Adiantum nelumboides]
MAKLEAARMPAPLHKPPSDDTKLKGALHASIKLYGKGNLEEDDVEHEAALMSNREEKMAGLDAWVYNAADEHDPRLPHRHHPNRPVSQDHLKELGVLHCRVDVDELQKQGATLIDKTIRDFGYDYWEIVTLAPHLVDNFKELTDKFYHEHLHPYDESRIILEGNGKCAHQDDDDAVLLFKEVPERIDLLRPQGDDIPARKEYVTKVLKNPEAHHRQPVPIASGGDDQNSLMACALYSVDGKGLNKGVAS